MVRTFPNTEPADGRNPLLARILNFYSRALSENNVRRVESNFPLRSDPQLELRRGQGTDSVHNFFGSVEHYRLGCGRMRFVDFLGGVMSPQHSVGHYFRILARLAVSTVVPVRLAQNILRGGEVVKSTASMRFRSSAAGVYLE
jgi:hypothetical protein